MKVTLLNDKDCYINPEYIVSVGVWDRAVEVGQPAEPRTCIYLLGGFRGQNTEWPIKQSVGYVLDQVAKV